MIKRISISLVVVFVALIPSLPSSLGYSIPTPTVKILQPKGFEISIPDEEGMQLVAFHGSINRVLRPSQPGDYHGESTEAVNGRWTYENKKPSVKPGDVLYYWIHVQHKGRGYRASSMNITFLESDVDSTDPDIDVRIPGRPPECIYSLTEVNGRKVCKGELIFSDDFEILDWSKWQREVRIPLTSEGGDFVSFQSDERNCYVRSGFLHIVPSVLTDVGYTKHQIRHGHLQLADCTPNSQDRNKECQRTAQFSTILPPVMSAKIRTKNTFSFKYGIVEVRAKLPKGDWLFPLILLEPKVNVYGSNNYASGQMRVAFIRGNEDLRNEQNIVINGKRLSGGVVLEYGENRDKWLNHRYHTDHLGAQRHTYTLEWTNEYVSVSMDGVEYGRTGGNFSNLNLENAQKWKVGGDMAPFDQEFFLSLGVSVGGVSEFPDGWPTKPWRNIDAQAELNFYKNMNSWYPTWQGENSGIEVDYVKVYAL